MTLVQGPEEYGAASFPCEMPRRVVWARVFGKQAFASLCGSAVEAFAAYAREFNASAEQVHFAAGYGVMAAVCGVKVNDTLYSPHWPGEWRRNWLRIAAYGARRIFNVDDVNYALASAKEQRERRDHETVGHRGKDRKRNG